MRFIDEVKIHIASGRGGDGCVAFRREKFVPRGGPNGGDGGAGGEVWCRGVRGKQSLLDFHYKTHFHAKSGQRGGGKSQHGANGESVTLGVPLGTLVRHAETGEVLLDVLSEEKQLLLPGGRGGKGNAHFKTSSNRVPMESTPGEEGSELWVRLELKLLADVGLVGLPNAGKSTFIQKISKARPKVADYPFTTLVPSLGVVGRAYGSVMVVADIPGIIEGAHLGAGLGLQFLRHIERTRALLFLLDVSFGWEKAFEAYHILVQELSAKSKALEQKKRVVALSKVDSSQEEEVALAEKKLLELEPYVFRLSSLNGVGLEALLDQLEEVVFSLKKKEQNSTTFGPSKKLPHSSEDQKLQPK